MKVEIVKGNNINLIRKYNIPVPRYTSYPTVPYWNEKINQENWIQIINKNISNFNQGVSIYIHLPFCETLCTFCGCNKKITKRHSAEVPYIEHLIKEWHIYNQYLNQKVTLKELHLGGGTPTFFSATNLGKLLSEIFKNCKIADDIELSFEAHPNNTTYEHLKVLNELGFKRVSLGIQEYNYKVQESINRVQTFDQVKKISELARGIGYESINHDLIYGLPHQKKHMIIDSMKKTLDIKPDRIAFYSYAHVPWVKGSGQRGFREEDIPTNEEKLELYQIGKNILKSNGYKELGMDHFALETDNLFIASQNNKLHRNFMGYTVSNSKLLIGLGISSISDLWYAFGQNEKDIHKYYKLIDEGKLAIFRGYNLNSTDLNIRQHILNIMCRMKTSWNGYQIPQIQNIISNLDEMKRDNLVKIEENGLEVTELGKPFLRNVCMAFDMKMNLTKNKIKNFSMTI